MESTASNNSRANNGNQETKPVAEAADKQAQDAAAPSSDPVKHFSDDLTKLSVKKSKYPPAMPDVKMNLRYKPLRHITHSDNYLYHVPKVFYD